MRKTGLASLILSILAMLVISGAGQAENEGVNRPIADKWALIIGISDFKDPSLNLKYPAKDAVDFYKFLLEKANFEPDHVKLVTDRKATRENILDLLGDKWLPRAAGRDDLVIIYISSHGSPSEMDLGRVNYVVAYDTDKDRLYSTGIAMQDLCRIIKKRIHTDRALVILDACHSGAADPSGKGLVREGNFDVDTIAQGTGQLVLSSSDSAQRSWESTNALNSVFTHYLLEGLNSSGDDTTLGQAFEYMKNKVEEEVRRERGVLQTPVLKGKWSGDDLRIAVVPISPKPGIAYTIKSERETDRKIAARDNKKPRDKELTNATKKDVEAMIEEKLKEKIAVQTPQPDVEKLVEQKMLAKITEPLHESIAVIDFDPPLEVDTDTSLGYRIRKGGSAEPSRGELTALPVSLRARLQKELSEIMPGKVVPLDKTTRILSNEKLQIYKGRGAPYFTRLGQLLKAKYLLRGSIDEVRFEGNTFTGDEYEIKVSARLISAEDGQVLWRMNNHKFSKKIFSDKRDPMTIFQDRVTGKAADYICRRVAKRMGIRVPRKR